MLAGCRIGSRIDERLQPQVRAAHMGFPAMGAVGRPPREPPEHVGFWGTGSVFAAYMVQDIMICPVQGHAGATGRAWPLSKEYPFRTLQGPTQPCAGGTRLQAPGGCNNLTPPNASCLFGTPAGSGGILG